jgi:mono/diheme cytochrome c family protein
MNKTPVRAWPALLGGALLALAHAAALAEAPGKGDKALVERGRYLVQIAGCNDCHTPGYMEAGGKVDEKLWLTGDALGWRGPWGTTYAINLRQYMAGLSEAQWLQRADTMQPRPPMPWFNIKAMSLQDRKAIYHYVKALGPGGKAAPAWLPPDKAPPQPYIQFP